MDYVTLFLNMKRCFPHAFWYFCSLGQHIGFTPIVALAGLPGFARDSSSKIIYISAFYFYNIYFNLFSLNIMAFPRLLMKY